MSEQGGAGHDQPAHAAADHVINLCRGHGFALVGACNAGGTEYASELQAWLSAGKHGEMAYLAQHAQAKSDPSLVLPGARSAVMVADLYHARHENNENSDSSRVSVDLSVGVGGRVARYAQGRDYHKVMKRRLHQICDQLLETYPGESFRAFTDTAPVPERELAARAGIGWTGKHTLAIHPRLGSWFVLGGFYTTMELGSRAAPMRDHCGTCTRCIDACPTQAITPYSVDGSRCISYLTIEHRSSITPELFEAMGDWVAGCDICQEVCPHNASKPGQQHASAPLIRDEYAQVRRELDLLEVVRWTEEDRRRTFAGSALTRIKLDMIRRNAIIALGNETRTQTDPLRRQGMLGVIRSLADDSSELVRTTSRDVLMSLGYGSGGDRQPETGPQRASPEE